MYYAALFLMLWLYLGFEFALAFGRFLADQDVISDD